LDLGLTAYKKRKVGGLTPAQIDKRLARCKSLLERYADEDVDFIVFCDEKFFTVEESFNSQNVRIYALRIEDVPPEMWLVERVQHPDKWMVFAAASKKGKFPLHFVEPGVSITAKYYTEEILKKVVIPEGKRIYGDDEWTFQQDSAPAHKAKKTQALCRRQIPDFIATKDWPPAGCDLNPLDYSLWGILEARVNAIRHTSMESLRQALLREWANLSMKHVRAAINSWRRRLQACVDAKGGRFEHLI